MCSKDDVTLCEDVVVVKRSKCGKVYNNKMYVGEYRMDMRGNRAVVKVKSAERLERIINDSKVSYYKIGSINDDKYFGYIEWNKTVDLRKLMVKYGCKFERLAVSRRCLLNHISCMCDGVVEYGEMKKCGGDVVRELWENSRRKYEEGDVSDIKEYILKVLSKGK